MKPLAAIQPQLPLPSDRQSGLYTISGPHAAGTPLLQLAAHLALNRTVRILDCGNRGDMYRIAKTLRGLTPDPVAVMSRVLLSRAFTCYQAEALLRNSRDLARTPILILDLLATFLDESVGTSEIGRLFRDTQDHLKTIAAQNFVIVSVSPPGEATAERAALWNGLTRLSTGFIQLDERSEARDGERVREPPAGQLPLF